MNEVIKKYQVFVSSTYEDLQSARRTVYEALLRNDCIPSGMEFFNAGDETQWEVICRSIDLCDYYIVIIAGRYGSKTKEGISYTEKEYRYAVEREIPVAAFVLDSSAPWAPKLVDKGKDAVKLSAFKELVKAKIVNFWCDEKDLAYQVASSINGMKKDQPRPGWIRHDQQNAKRAAKLNIALRFDAKKDAKEIEIPFLPLPTKELANAQRIRDEASTNIGINYMTREMTRDSATIYASLLESYCKEVSRTVKVNLVVENLGEELVEDIDVTISTSVGTYPVDEIPDMPNKPDRYTGGMAYAIPNMSRVGRNIDPLAVKGPDAKDSTIWYRVPRVKNGSPIVLPEFFLRFTKDTMTATLDYRLVSARPHDVACGKLTVTAH